MDAQTLNHALADMLNWMLEERDDPDDPLADLIAPVAGIDSVRTFAEADIPSTEPGLVIGCDDGTEFQVTVHRSS